MFESDIAFVITFGVFALCAAIAWIIVYKALQTAKVQGRVQEAKSRNAIHVVATREREGMGKITINGKTYTGNKIRLSGNTVFIDDRAIDNEEDDRRIVKVIVEGDLASLKTESASVEVRGDVYGNVDAGGSVQCDNVTGAVRASGSVQCDRVGADVNAGGSVQCDDIGGNVRAGGSVIRS